MTLNIPDLKSLPLVADEFVKAIGDRRIIAFYGKMGVGKTTFIKALCERIGVTDVINSPTFAIVNEYRSGSGEPVFHFDFYRIKRADEVFDIGFEEYIDSGCLCLMEWPEMIEDYLPEETVKVVIAENTDGSRTLTLD